MCKSELFSCKNYATTPLRLCQGLPTHLLLATCYVLLTAYYLLLTTCYLLLTTCYLLLTTCYLLLATCYLLLTTPKPFLLLLSPSPGAANPSFFTPTPTPRGWESTNLSQGTTLERLWEQLRPHMRRSQPGAQRSTGE